MDLREKVARALYENWSRNNPKACPWSEKAFTQHWYQQADAAIALVLEEAAQFVADHWRPVLDLGRARDVADSIRALSPQTKQEDGESLAR